MTDFVRTLQDYATSKGWHYSYGRKSNLNLLSARTKLANDKIYLLHEASPRRPEKNKTGTAMGSILFTGHFFLVVKSTMDMPYLNEKGNDEANSKYVKNIEPLLTLWQGMFNYLIGCEGELDILLFEAIDAVNILDENRDGILVSYQVRATL
jgi:hypothetical protein